MKQCFCVLICYFYIQLVCSQTHLHLISFICCFILFWRAIHLNTENRRRFVCRRQDISGILQGFPVKLNISVENRGPFCPYETSPHCFAREKVGSRYGGALFFFHTVILGTNTFVLILFFYLLPFFSIVHLAEKVHQSFINSSVFSIR